MLEHLGLNLLHLVPRETGGSETYARGLVPALLEARPDLRVTVFAGREGAPELAAEPWASDATIVRVPVSGRSRTRRVLAEQTLLPAAARRAGVDLLHNVFTTAPAIAGVPQVTTIHDLIYKRFPETHAGALAQGLALLVEVAARRSRRIIVPSQATAEDIVSFLGVDRARIDVAYHGPGMAPDLDPPAGEELRRSLDLGDAPLVLTVSAIRRHKNLARLIEAMASVPDDALLLAPGYATSHEDELTALARRAGVEDRVRMLGWVDDATLDGLYRAARCFVFPSLAEGFGLPVLEAMLRGAPVACSNATSLPEVAGDAALLFDPHDTAAIADAITRILSDDALAARLREAGRERAARFTWRASAEAHLDSYERALA